jgi:hypothetical protein
LNERPGLAARRRELLRGLQEIDRLGGAVSGARALMEMGSASKASGCSLRLTGSWPAAAGDMHGTPAQDIAQVSVAIGSPPQSPACIETWSQPEAALAGWPARLNPAKSAHNSTTMKDRRSISLGWDPRAARKFGFTA